MLKVMYGLIGSAKVTLKQSVYRRYLEAKPLPNKKRVNGT